jgi:hypothetical protein
MERLFVTVLCLILSLSLSGCSSKAEEGAIPDNSQESTLGPNGARLGPNALGVNGLPLLPDEAAEGVCFTAFHLFLDFRDPATYEYSEDPAVNGNISKALEVQELWNEIKWMDEKFGTTFAKFALDMGKFAAQPKNGFDSLESENWCNSRSIRVDNGSP